MADIYKIGIEIALVGSAVAGLELIATKMLGINKLSKDVEGGFTRWGVALGVAGVAVGGVLAAGLKHAVEAGGELVKQQTLLKNMLHDGRSDAQIMGDVMEATAKAQAATHDVIDQADRRKPQGHARTDGHDAQSQRSGNGLRAGHAGGQGSRKPDGRAGRQHDANSR